MISQFMLNPIIALEWRARWRGTRAFRLLFLCAALLGVVAFFSYLSAVETWDFASTRNTAESSARAGAGLFLGLSVAQLLGWMLIAPLMTATTIAAEREQGILEGVQLSHLKPLQIVTGKLWSALIFALLLGSTTLPIVGICFMLGGVSPGEFMQSWVLQFSTALCGACAGLFFSAHSRRAGVALRATLIALVAWCIASGVLFIIGIGATMGGSLTPLGRIGAQLAMLQGFLNPTVVSGYTSLNRFGAGFSTAASAGTNPIENLLATILSQPPWMICLTLQLLASLFFLAMAARALRRPLGEFDESAARRKRPQRAKNLAAPTTQTAASTRDAPISANAMDANANATKAVATKAVASTRELSDEARSGAAWWEVPYFSRLKFDNPMLQREVRSKFRMRRVSLVVVLIEGALALGVLYLYLRAMGWALTDASARATIWWVLSWTGLVIILVATPVMGASSFTRERETGTFEGVMLSLLSNRDIERGKLLAPLFACAAYGVLPLLPLLVLCLRPQAYKGYSAGTWLQGITVWQALATFCVLGAAAFAGTSLGMAASWTARRTSEAVGRSLGIMFIWLALLPAFTAAAISRFTASGAYDPTRDTAAKMLGVFGNPLLAMGFLSGNETLLFDFSRPFAIAFLSLCGSVWLATLAHFYLARAMHKRALEQERKR